MKGLTFSIYFLVSILSVNAQTKTVTKSDGLVGYITPHFSFKFDRGQVYAVLDYFESKIDGQQGFKYQGMWTDEPKFYNSESFGGALYPYFNALSVEHFDVILKINGPNPACNQAAQPAVKEGSSIQVCGSPTEIHGYSIQDYDIKYFKLKAEAEIKLKEKINELEKNEIDKKQKIEKESAEKKAKDEQLKKDKENSEKNSEANKDNYKTAADAISRGDAYLKQGNYAMALREFELAQLSYQAAGYYNQEVAQKISDVKMSQGATQLAQGLSELGDLMENTLKKMDPEGKFSWNFIGLNYETAIPNSNGIAYSQPALDIELSFLSFAFGVKFGYMQNEMQYFNVEHINYWGQEEHLPETITLASKGINVELLAGFNIPVKNFCIRPMYGISVLTSDAYSITRTEDFTLKSSIPDFKAGKVNRASLALYYQIPKTSIGVGLHFNYLFQNRYHFGFDKSEQIELNYIGNNPDYQNSSTFYVANPKTTEKESVNTFTTSISFIFGLKKKR